MTTRTRTHPDVLTRVPVLTHVPKTTAHAHPGDVERDVETIR